MPKFRGVSYIRGGTRTSVLSGTLSADLVERVPPLECCCVCLSANVEDKDIGPEIVQTEHHRNSRQHHQLQRQLKL